MKVGDYVRFKAEGSKLDNEIAKIVEFSADQKRVVLEVVTPVRAAGFPEQNFRWETVTSRVLALDEENEVSMVKTNEQQELALYCISWLDAERCPHATILYASDADDALVCAEDRFGVCIVPRVTKVQYPEKLVGFEIGHGTEL